MGTALVLMGTLGITIPARSQTFAATAIPDNSVLSIPGQEVQHPHLPVLAATPDIYPQAQTLPLSDLSTLSSSPLIAQKSEGEPVSTEPVGPITAEDTVPATDEPSSPGEDPESEEGEPEPPQDTSPEDTSPPATIIPPPPAPETTPEATDPQVLVSEVVVRLEQGDDQELILRVYEAISTRPGQVTTRSQIQADINAIFATGFFGNVRAVPQDTPLGVQVTFFVTPNPILRSVQVAGNEVLTQEKVEEIFSPQYDRILNLRDLQEGIKEINEYYQEEGYVLAQVIGTPQVDPDGTVTLQVAEGVVEGIEVRYLNADGEPAKGKTKQYILIREMKTKPDTVLNRDTLQRDLQVLFGLGLFEDVQVALEPGEDSRKVVVTLNVQERGTGTFSFGAGFSSRSGIFGTGSFSQSNFRGRNQRINVQGQVGERLFGFDVSFTDPWLRGDPYRTSYTANLFNRLTIPLVFDVEGDLDGVGCGVLPAPAGPPCDVRLPNGDRIRINRFGGGVVFSRPWSKDPDKVRTAWTPFVGIRYQRVSSRDGDLSLSPVDQFGNPLTFSGTGEDDLFGIQFGVARDRRNDPIDPTKGYALRLGAEQWLPIGKGSILGTRVRGSFSYYLPISLLKLSDGPQALAFNIQAGTVQGDLPPYEAFTLGGTNSIRGFEEGNLGSGRRFAQATVEYRFPIIKFLGGITGVVFVDAGTTLGSQDEVLGTPGIIRGKPGEGVGFGGGIRVKTPIGPVRLDYGRNNDGDDRFHFGFGQRF